MALAYDTLLLPLSTRLHRQCIFPPRHAMESKTHSILHCSGPRTNKPPPRERRPCTSESLYQSQSQTDRELVAYLGHALAIRLLEQRRRTVRTLLPVPLLPALSGLWYQRNRHALLAQIIQ